MIRKLDDLVIYKDPYYYLAFPSCVTLSDGRVLITCRRALDPRYLLEDGFSGDLRNWCSHVEARSHNAMVVLDSSLRPTGPHQSVPINPQAADQDGSLLRLANGRVLLTGFSWYATEVANYGTAFGNVATLAVLIFWIYYGSVVFILGGEVAQVYTMRKASRVQVRASFEAEA